MIVYTLLLHGPKLQGRVSVIGPNPVQSLPYPEGVGFVHVLSLACVPFPHVFEHEVALLQFDTPPSRPDIE